jgi:hypothetical protein
LDCIGVLDFELDTCLSDGAVAWPLLAPEAGLSGLAQRPHGGVLTAANVLAVEVVAALDRLERRAQRTDVELATLGGIGGMPAMNCTFMTTSSLNDMRAGS